MPGSNTRRLGLLLGLVAALVLSTSASAQTTKLTGIVGPGFNISITKGGKKLLTVRAGRYTIAVADRSNIHNFHLKGLGVNKDSGVAQTGNKSWMVTLKRGRYVIVCDPHASPMKDSFVVN
ncbi:MAG: hypothetical protein H0T39_07770 [Actinobacteria bacterium]|nr:hypothetical protein [Actinomycetota bacterium]